MYKIGPFTNFKHIKITFSHIQKKKKKEYYKGVMKQTYVIYIVQWSMDNKMNVKTVEIEDFTHTQKKIYIGTTQQCLFNKMNVIK